MTDDTWELKSVRTLAHGTYEGVTVVEHRRRGGGHGATPEESQAVSQRPLIVLQMANDERVIDRGKQYQMDGVISADPPKIGERYTVVISTPRNQTGFGSDGSEGGSLEYRRIVNKADP